MKPRSREKGNLAPKKPHAWLDILKSLSAADASELLRTLVISDKDIAEKTVQLAKARMEDVDPEDVSGDVLSALDSLDVEDVWDRSGAKRGGYVDPGDMAWEMFEEALTPYTSELAKLQTIGMKKPAKRYCMGILKGIYLFHKKSTTEYKDWATDAPGEYFNSVYDDWWKGSKNKAERKEILAFIRKECPEWVHKGQV